MIDLLKKYSSNIFYDTLKDLAYELYHTGIVSIPISLSRDKSGKVVKKITARWGELVTKENLSWEDIEKVWEEVIHTKKGTRLVEDYRKVIRHRGIAILTGAISGLTVVDIDDEQKARELLGDKYEELLNSTLVVRTPNKGIHLYFKYDPDLPTTTNIYPKIDIRNDKGLVVTYPSVVWDENNPCYELITEKEPIEVPKWLKELLLKKDKEKKETTSLYINKESRRELPTREISKLADLFVPIWKEGHRHNLTQYLAGFLYKQKVSCESIKRLIEKIVYSANDEEAERRIKFVDYECDRFEGTPAEDIKGYSGIKEELEAIVEEGIITESGYLHILEEINNLFPAKKEKRSDIFVRIGDNPKWGYASLSKYDSIKEWRETKKEGFHFRSTIAWGHIIDLEVVRPPAKLSEETDKIWNLTYSYAGEIYRFKGTPAEVLSALEENGFLINPRKAKEAFMSILGRLERERGIQKKWLRWGIFPTEDGGIELNHPHLEGYTPTDDDIRNALKVLDVYVSIWSEKKLTEVSAVVKFAIASPFYFVRKAFTNRPWQWLALIGESDTGKTEDARLTKRIWNVPYEVEINASSIQTEARLAKQVDAGTFALIVNEVGNIFSESAQGSHIQEMLKSIWGDTVARTHLSRTRRQRVSFALAPFIFTSNHPLKLSSSLSKRIKVITYPLRAKVTPEDKKNFALAFPEGSLERELKPLAAAVFEYVKNNLKLLKEADTFEDFGEQILTYLYEKYVGTVPSWVSLRPEDSESNEEDSISGYDILLYLLEFINTQYMNTQRLTEEFISVLSVDRRLARIQTTIPTFPVRYDATTEKVFITKEFLQFLSSKGIEAPSLKWLYEKLSELGEAEAELVKATNRRVGLNGRKVVAINMEALRKVEADTKTSLNVVKIDSDNNSCNSPSKGNNTEVNPGLDLL